MSGITAPVVRQFRAGTDLAAGDEMASDLANFAYLLIDPDSGEALAVDPAFDPDALAAAATASGLRIRGILATHAHADHVGGLLFGRRIPGVLELARLLSVPVHAHEADASDLLAMTGLPAGSLVAHPHGDRVPVGRVRVACVHTPGHSPGSCCWWAGRALLTGDTLFVQGCGRTDLPGGDPEEQWRSLNRRLAALPGDLVVWSGHDYGDRPFATLSELRRTNATLQIPDLETWRALLGV